MWFASLLCAVALALPASCARVPSRSCKVPSEEDRLTSVHNFTLPDLLQTKNVSLSEYQGRVLLLVNVATYCGFTWHYTQLNALKSTYNYTGFEVLGFPCNQFAKQEPGGNGEEIMNGITYVRPGKGFHPNFPLFKKIDVNGENEHPLYTYLKSMCPATRDYFAPQTKLFYTPITVTDIRWNFEKFLIDTSGIPVMRYDASTPPNDIANDIATLLGVQRQD